MRPERIVDCRCVVGEAPLWHPDEQRLYWVDIPQGKLLRYDPTTGAHALCYQGGVIGGFTLQADGALLLFMGQGAVGIWRAGQPLAPVIEEIPQERDSRFNDVIADPEGRVFCGTRPTEQHLSRLYRLEPDGTVTELLDDIRSSNGMGFTPDRTGFYYTDTRRHLIYLFDYERETGVLSRRRVFAQAPEGEGRPDGLTVDAEGYVWSARWDGGLLVRYTPSGAEDLRIAFPARKVSSVTFGGPNYTDIYVTTAGGDRRAEEGDGAGALFHLNLGIRGVPEFRSRIGLQGHDPGKESH